MCFENYSSEKLNKFCSDFVHLNMVNLSTERYFLTYARKNGISIPTCLLLSQIVKFAPRLNVRIVLVPIYNHCTYRDCK